jgi:hypothetical protein
MKRGIVLISITASVLLAGPVFNSAGVEVLKEHPLSVNSRGADSGNNAAATIDKYKDGVGVIVTTVDPDREINYAPLNSLVYKYGKAAKESSNSIKDFVTLSGNVSNQEDIETASKIGEHTEVEVEQEPDKYASCKEILNSGTGTTNGVYELSSGINVYCDMNSDGGGWTLVAAQLQSDPVVNWNEGIQADYDPSLATGKGFTLSSTQIPAHTQVSFSAGLNSGLVNIFNMTYSTGDYDKSIISGVKYSGNYYIHRNSTSFYSNHDPEQDYFYYKLSNGNFGLCDPGGTNCRDIGRPDHDLWTNTLTIAKIDGSSSVFGNNWAFSPKNETAIKRSFAMNGTHLAGTNYTNPFTIWVK